MTGQLAECIHGLEPAWCSTCRAELTPWDRRAGRFMYNTHYDRRRTMSEQPDSEPEWEAERSPGPWAIVEIMGHRVRAGSISVAGAAMLQVQHPTVADHAGTQPLTELFGAMLQVQHPTVADHAGTQPLTELFGASALFSVRPCSRAEAVRWAENHWRSSQPVPTVAELEATIDAYVVEDYPDDFGELGVP